MKNQGSMTQAPTHRFNLCGRACAVTPDPRSPYEFYWRCDPCMNAGTISWAHAHEPPTWQGEAQPALPLESE